MKVFISWSGSPSKEIAEVLNRYIADIIQEAEPFYSPDSIKKGDRWSNAINGELDNSSFGILCITKNNFNSPWINYEAGALTRPVKSSKICPLLFDMQPSDITHNPLTMYQITVLNETDMFKLFQSLNESCEKPMPIDRLKRTFERVWADIEKEIENIRKIFKNENDKPKIDQNNMIREVLDIVRIQNSKNYIKEYDKILDVKLKSLKYNDNRVFLEAFKIFSNNFGEVLEKKLNLFKKEIDDNVKMMLKNVISENNEILNSKIKDDYVIDKNSFTECNLRNRYDIKSIFPSSVLIVTENILSHDYIDKFKKEFYQYCKCDVNSNNRDSIEIIFKIFKNYSMSELVSLIKEIAQKSRIIIKSIGYKEHKPT